MAFVDILGYAASALVLCTFCMRTMIPLRLLALASNVLFISYGYLDHLLPVLGLHCILLPVNTIRLLEFRRLVKAIRDARSSELSVNSLLPYMKRRMFSAGDVLVRKGERADRLYYLLEGQLQISELGKTLTVGAIIGEIGVFSPNQTRTATVTCLTDCVVLELTEQKARELYFEDRAFSYAVLQLIIQRLSENNERLLHNRSA